jgi:hypothetical protein
VFHPPFLLPGNYADEQYLEGLGKRRFQRLKRAPYSSSNEKYPKHVIGAWKGTRDYMDRKAARQAAKVDVQCNAAAADADANGWTASHSEASDSDYEFEMDQAEAEQSALSEDEAESEDTDGALDGTDDDSIESDGAASDDEDEWGRTAPLHTLPEEIYIDSAPYPGTAGGLGPSLKAASHLEAQQRYGQAADARANLTKICGCLCCDELRFQVECKEVSLLEPAPGRLGVLEYDDDVQGWNPMLREQYRVDCLHTDFDTSWLNLGISNQSQTDDGTALWLCDDCDKALKTKTMPKFAIMNGLHCGYGRLIAEIARLNDGEKEALSRGANVYNSVVKTVYFTDPKQLQRQHLHGHYYVRQLCPEEVVAAVDAVASDGGDAETVIHLVVDNMLSQEDVDKALVKCKKSLKVDATNYLAAATFYKTHNPAMSPEEELDELSELNIQRPATITKYEDLPVGIREGTVVVEKRDMKSRRQTGPVDIADKGPDESTVVQDSNSLPRTGAVVSFTTEAAAKAGTFTVNNVVHQSKAVFKCWEKESVPKMYPHLMPFGTGGPGESRAVPISWRAWVAHCLRKKDRAFAQDPRFSIQQFSVDRLSILHHVRSHGRKSDGTVPATTLPYTEADITVAAEYLDACSRARERNKRPPPIPPDYHAGAAAGLQSSLKATAHAIGTEKYALRQRRYFQDMSLFFGENSMWATTSENDIGSPEHAVVAGASADDPAPVRAEAVARDPAACAILHLKLIEVYCRHFLGWDYKKKKPIPGGGIYGVTVAFAGVTEEQLRLSLHLHMLSVTAGMPKSPKQMEQWLESPEFRKDFLTFCKLVQGVGVGLSAEELVKVGDADDHEIAKGVRCKDHRAEPAAPLDDGTDLSDVDTEEHPSVGKAVFSLVPLEQEYAKPTSVRRGVGFPKNLECECGTRESPYEFAKTWALANCSAHCKATYLSEMKNGYKGLFGVEIDLTKAISPEGEFNDTDDAREARSALILLHFLYNNHDPGHRQGCFKVKGGANYSGCRFRIPHLTAQQSTTIVINGEFVITLQNCGDATQWQHGEIKSVELEIGWDRAFPYTAPHNHYHIAAFRCNTNSTVVACSAGLSFYLTSYASKLPSCKEYGLKMAAAYVRAWKAELAKASAGEDRTVAQQVNTVHSRMTQAVAGTAEIAGTTIALYFLNDRLINHYSHDFARIFPLAFMSWLTNKPYDCRVSKGKDQYTVKNPVHDFVFRDPKLAELGVYFLASAYVKEKCSTKQIATMKASDDCKKVAFTDGHPDCKTHCLRLRKRNKFLVPNLVGLGIPNNVWLEKESDEAVRRAHDYRLIVIALFMPYSFAAKPFIMDNPTEADVRSFVREQFDAFMGTAPVHVLRILQNAQARHDSKDQAERLRLAREDDGTCSGWDKAGHGVGNEVDPDFEYEAEISESDPSGTILRTDLTSTVIESSCAPVSTPPAEYLRTAAHPHSFPGHATFTVEAQNQLDASLTDQTTDPSSRWSEAPRQLVALGTAATNNLTMDAPGFTTILVQKVHGILTDFQNPANAEAPRIPIADIGDYAGIGTIARAFGLDASQKQTFTYTVGVHRILSRLLDVLEEPQSANLVARILIVRQMLAEISTELNVDCANLKHVYLGGPAGAGKSQVIKAIQKFAQAWGVGQHVSTVAYTGSAAVQLGGSTMHSFIGASCKIPKDGTVAESVFKRKKEKASLWLLILDEISFVSPDFFGYFERCVAVLVGKEDTDFGGALLLSAGDFRQCNPPSTKIRLFDFQKLLASSLKVESFTRRGCDLWQRLDIAVCLKKNFRARIDPDFALFLDNLRNGVVTDEHLIKLNARQITASNIPEPQTCVLCPTNKDAAMATRRFAQLDAQRLNRRCLSYVPEMWNKLRGGTRLQADVRDQILIGNDAAKAPLGLMPIYFGQRHMLNPGNKYSHLGISNGCLGSLIGTYPPTNLHMPYTGAEDSVLPEYMLFFLDVPGDGFVMGDLPPNVFPLKVSFSQMAVKGFPSPVAVKYFACRPTNGTFHKYQGQTLESVIICRFLAAYWAANGAYVALSRARSWAQVFTYVGATATLKKLISPDTAAELEYDRLASLDISGSDQVADEAAGPA